MERLVESGAIFQIIVDEIMTMFFFRFYRAVPFNSKPTPLSTMSRIQLLRRQYFVGIGYIQWRRS